ncbi:MAG TPA: FecR domain-containing protein [Polyangiaceae bacterium]|jgi:ferric-dicitrate binding protein FerR (iron transport regulator)
MDERDLEAWDAEEPPRGFAERVVAAARREDTARARPRAARVLAGLLLAAAMAAVVGLGVHRQRADAHGSVTADERREVRVGTRALAVLEPGAHVKWDGDAIEQDAGDVFWRVEPGARFVVHTPAAEVAVKGTCFRVNVREGEDEMERKSVVSGAVGALIAATAMVGVYEGKVAVSHAGQTVDLTAGQTAEAGPGGVRRVGANPGDGVTPDPAAAQGTEGERALTVANANLADNVRDYRRKLEAIEAQKKTLEKELAEAQAKLADGGVPKSDYELSPQDLKELAKEGEVRMRVPCGGPKGDYAVSADTLNKLGLAPQDGPILQAAYAKSHERSWGVIEPLCSQALGGADVTHIGQQACVSILMNMASEKNAAAYDEDVRDVAEILAGTRPPPAPGATVDPLVTAYLALAGETGTIQSELTQSLGPDDARRAVFGDHGCWWNSSHGVGPRDPQ